YASFKNPGSGTTNGSYWNATVVVTADKVSAEGIIFENSFNQYMSKKAAEDVIEKQSGAKELAGQPRAKMEAGDTTVQNKAYVERAAALAIYNNQKEIYFDNCKFIGRQDTLYGGTGVTAAFYNCSVYGGTDYIFGGMTAVFAKCDLVFNTMEDNNDVGYITAAQTPENQRGLLMWNCTVTSTTPGEDTASKNTSKAGYLGRPWQAKTGEAVFYETIVEATCAEYYKASASLIQPAGWNSSLGGESALSQEYNTHEWAMDVTTGKQLDNSAKRLSWSKVLTEEEAEAITVEAFLGDWKPFTAEALKIDVPTGMGKVNNMPVGSVDASKMTLTNLGADAEGKGQVLLTWKALHKAEADKYVITVTNKDVTTETPQTFEVDNSTNDGEDVLQGKVTLEKTLTGLTVDSTYEVSIGTERGSGDGADKEHGTPAVKTIKVTGEEEKPDDGSLKDPENGTKFELPITLEGLLKGQKYSGGFSVTEDFYPYGKKDATTGDKKTVAGVDYALWLQGTNNPKTNGKNPGGKIPDTGAALVLDALADGVVTFICNNDGKAMSFVDATEGGDGVAILQAVKWEDKVYKFEVKKGHKYYFYAEGSKLMLCGAYVVYEGDVTDPDDEVSFDGWDKVAKPVIDSVTYASGDGDDKLTVTVKADVSDKGGTSLDVTVKKEGSTTGQTQTSKTKQTTHTFVFTVSGPGKYEVTAALKRKGQTDKITTKTVTVNANGQTVVSGGREGLYVELLDDDTDYIYTGSAIKPAIAVYNGDELLREGTDYTVKYSNNVKAAKKDSGKKAPTITVTGKGRFTGKTTQTFTIQPRDLDDVVIGGLSKDAADTLIVVENAKISPVLVYKGVVLKAGDKKDFTLTTGIAKDKPAKTDTGKEITITGVNNYTGELKLTLDVKSKSELKKISSVKIDKTAKYYDGTEQDVTITEVKAGKDVVAAEDYLIVYNGDKTSAGTQKFTVVGVGIYAGSKTSSYKINPRKATLTLTNALAENGTVTCGFNSAGVTFNDAITVTDEGLNNAELVLGKDYKVSYSGNKKVGTTAKYTVTFLGNYKGSAALKNTFTITAANLAEMTETNDPSEKDGLYLKSADKAYTKAAAYKSAPFVLVNGVALKTSDYTVKYYLDEAKTTEMKGKNKVTLGEGETSKTVYVEITGKKNYSGTVMTSFDVVSTTEKTDISKAKITVKDSAGKKQSKVEYTGEAVYPYSIEIKVGKATPILLKYDADTASWVTSDGSATQDFDILVVNNIEKGKATIIVTGDGANVGSKTATFNVVSHSLANVPAEFWSDFKDLKGLLGL
ncbi:MAG: hypothetical protein K2K10_01090, partial [Acetatifactor sp.]|nr:hypothetical protein [Acetatifactor sp.]